MRRYKAYNKQQVAAVINGLGIAGKTVSKTPNWKPKKTVIDVKELQKESSFFQPSKWPGWWEEGAKELEKTTPGKIITAPVRLTEAALTSTTQTVREVPEIVKTIRKTIPFLVIAAALVGGGYLVYRFKKENLQNKKVVQTL